MRGKIIRSIVDDIYDEGKQKVLMRMYRDGVSEEKLAEYAGENIDTIRNWISKNKVESDISLLEKNAYFQKKLEEQLERTAERIIMRYENSAFGIPTKEDLIDITGLSEEKIDQIVQKHRWKKNCAENYRIGFVEGELEVVYSVLAGRECQAEGLVRALGIESQYTQALKENLKGTIAMEAVAHGLTRFHIEKILGITWEEAGCYMPDPAKLQDYKCFLSSPEPLSDDELEERYRKEFRWLV